MPGQVNILLSYGGGSGGGSGVALAPNYSASAYMPFPSTANARLVFSNDGNVYRIVNSNPAVSIGTWGIGVTASDYNIRYTTISGSLTTGSEATWENLGSSRTYGRNSSSGTQTASGTIEIQDATTLSIIDSATITLQADSS